MASQRSDQIAGSARSRRWDSGCHIVTAVCDGRVDEQKRIDSFCVSAMSDGGAALFQHPTEPGDQIGPTGRFATIALQQV